MSLAVLAGAFVAVSAVANKNTEMDMMSQHLQLLEEASLINSDALSPENLTQIGQQKEVIVVTKK
jgi:hypothetical protein